MGLQDIQKHFLSLFSRLYRLIKGVISSQIMTFSAEHDLRDPLVALLVEIHAARTAGVGFGNMIRLQVLQAGSVHEMQNLLRRMLAAAALRQAVFEIALAHHGCFAAVAPAIPRAMPVDLPVKRHNGELSISLSGQIFRFFMYFAAAARRVSRNQNVSRQQDLLAAVAPAAPEHTPIGRSLVGLLQHRQGAEPLSG